MSTLIEPEDLGYRLQKSLFLIKDPIDFRI